MAISTSKSWQGILEQATKRCHDLDNGVPERMAQRVGSLASCTVVGSSTAYPPADGSLPKIVPVKVRVKNDPAGFLSPELEQELQHQAERALVGSRQGAW
jgi:hypothetical protein